MDFEAFEEIRRRLMARGAADDFVTDFGPDLSLFFRDPDGLEGEVLVENPDAVPGVFNPPGTRAACFPAPGLTKQVEHGGLHLTHDAEVPELGRDS